MQRGEAAVLGPDDHSEKKQVTTVPLSFMEEPLQRLKCSIQNPSLNIQGAKDNKKACSLDQHVFIVPMV